MAFTLMDKLAILHFLTDTAYSFHCDLFTNERIQKFNETRHLHLLNCDLLLFGYISLPEDKTVVVFDVVHKYTFPKSW